MKSARVARASLIFAVGLLVVGAGLVVYSYTVGPSDECLRSGGECQTGLLEGWLGVYCLAVGIPLAAVTGALVWMRSR
jgi:hypothetical protein